MRRLDGASAFMIYNETPGNYQHTLKIAILDWKNSSEEYDYDRLVKNLITGTEKFPMLKWKLARVPFGLNHPVWIQDIDFSIAHHIRRIACPGNKDKAAFSELVSELYSQPLDLSRPLWQIWVVEDLPGGQVGVVTLLHHAYADGAGASMLMQGLMDPSEVPGQTSDELGVNSIKNPNPVTLLLKGLIDLPVIFAKYLPKLIKASRRQKKLVDEYAESGKPIPPDPKFAPDSRFNTIPSHGRTFSFDSYDLPEFKAVSKHFGVTINDLFVAVVSSAARQFLLDRQEDPQEPLVAVIPINARTEEQKKEVLGNHLDTSRIFAPVHEADPIKRLELAAASAQTMKEHHQAIGGTTLMLAMNLLPPLITTLNNIALRRAKGQLKLLGNLVISNVRGPTKPMTMTDGEVVQWLSIGQNNSGVGLNVTAWSYVDKFSMCLMSDRTVVQDGTEFMGYLRRAYDEYKALSPAEQAASQ